MTMFDALLLGVVEGITEFLPVSSTGHLILTSSLLGLAHSEFLKSFEIVIQLGAILAIVALYAKSFTRIDLLQRIFVAFIPTSIIGLAAYRAVKTYLLGNELVVVAALALGGIAIIAFEKFHAEPEPSDTANDVSSISYKHAFIIGLFQAIAIIPGVSRSAATILGGLSLGLSRRTIVEFSFLLAVPTMMAASALDLVKNAGAFSTSDVSVLAVGFVTSGVVAFLAVRWLLAFIRTERFTAFGYYRILAAIAYYALAIR